MRLPRRSAARRATYLSWSARSTSCSSKPWMLRAYSGYGRWNWVPDLHGCGLGGVGALDRGGSAAGKTPPQDLRRTISAIFWRHQNGAKWRSIPTELGPWWLAAQLFIRWAKRGVWERLLELVRQRGIALGVTILDGTNILAHQKAAGAKKGGPTARSEMCARRLSAPPTSLRGIGRSPMAALAAAMAPRPA